MYTRLKIFICFLFAFPLTPYLLPLTSLSAQTYNFRNYSVDDGLPFIEVSTIFQDSKGYLWSGGYGGLSRFDGKNFVNYAPKDGLADHSVTCIAEDNTTGKIWIGTISGISVFDGRNFRNYTTKEGLPDNNVSCIISNRNGSMLVGTAKGYVFYTHETLDTTKKNLLPAVSISSVVGSLPGQFWLGTGNGVNMLQGNFDRTEQVANPAIQRSKINALAFDSKTSSLWIATDAGLWCHDRTKNIFTSYHIKDGLPDEKINALTIDPKGMLWIGTDKGLCRFDGQHFFSYTINEDLNSNLIHSLYVDYEGNLWIGTFSGLYKHRDDAFISFSKKDGLSTTFVYPIVRDKYHHLWVGTNQGGLFHYVNGKFINYTMKDGLPGNTINTALLDRDSNVWIGTDNGLSLLVNDHGKISFRNHLMKEGLISDSVTYIMQDKKGLLWLGGHGGVTVFDPKAPAGKNFTKVPFPAADHDNYDVWFIMQDSKGRIWFGTYLGGVFWCDPDEGNKVHYFNKEHPGFKSRSAFGIVEDRDGSFYFGTFEGVIRYEPSKNGFVSFSEKDGMSSDLVYSIVADEGGNTLWAGTNQGLNKIDMEEFRRSGRKAIEPYGKEEGFTGVECNSTGIFREADGTIWFGTVNGLIEYNPREFRENTMESKTNITGFKLFYNDTLLQNQVRLNWYDNNISFEFIGICLTNPAKVRYSYMLEGADKEWSPETKNSIARFSNLAPGTYTFKVKSRNNEGKWNVQPTTFTFTVLTPWWKTWWFRVLFIMAIVSAVYFGVRFRVRQVEMNEHNKVLLANNELKALRAQMNPHFIFNALNSIQHFIMSSDEQGASKYLNKFAKLIRSILNNTEKTSVSLKDEVESLRLYIELEMLRFENKFDYEIKVDTDTDPDFYEVPTLLIQPYVENAIIHGLVPLREGGHLRIHISIENNFIVCVITDNGIGRKRSAELRAGSVKKGHRSLGMKITRDRLELLNSVHNSSLSVNITDLYDEAGQPAGTKVEIFIPVV